MDTVNMRKSIATLVVLLICAAPASAAAHGDPILCDTREDVVEQCGPVHACMIDPDVDENIGVCQGDFEEESFTVCDRRREEETCPMGQVCRIGNIDPNIGACVVDPFAGFDDGDQQEGDDSDEDEPTCAMTSPSSPIQGPRALLLLLAFGLVANLRRSRRSRR